MMKIFGCGNPDRGDDRAGLMVAQQLREQGLAAEMHSGEPLELIDAWGGADDVILVDAVVTGAPVGTVHRWDRWPVNNAGGAPVSSHGFDLAKTIELAQTLGRIPIRLRLYGIEGSEFDPGSEISPEVQRAVEIVVEKIKAEVL